MTFSKSVNDMKFFNLPLKEIYVNYLFDSRMEVIFDCQLVLFIASYNTPYLQQFPTSWLSCPLRTLLSLLSSRSDYITFKQVDLTELSQSPPTHPGFSTLEMLQNCKIFLFFSFLPILSSIFLSFNTQYLNIIQNTSIIAVLTSTKLYLYVFRGQVIQFIMWHLTLMPTKRFS